MASITVSKPFPGIHLWLHFNKGFELITGYPADGFEFVVGQTPLSTLKETFLFVGIYYLIIFLGRKLMEGRAPFKLSSLFLVHNLCLTAISGILLALYIEEIVPTLLRKGVLFAICDRNGGWTQHLVVLYYLTYLTKYLELLDTVFLFLRKKPLTFLHCYHHGATAVLCYLQLIGHTSVSWVVISLNLAVHVLMYWYYFQRARGVQVWWKEWVTRLQVIQFVIDLGFVYFASYTYFASVYFPWMPNVGSCAGEEFAALAGMGILTSYLVLFIGFYAATYRKDRRRLNIPRTPHRISQVEAVTSNGVKATGIDKGNSSIRVRKV